MLERGWLVPVRAQPADEFERGLGEALESLVNQGERLLRLLQCGFLLFQAFLFPLAFSDIGHALLQVQILHEQQEVVAAVPQK